MFKSQADILIDKEDEADADDDGVRVDVEEDRVVQSPPSTADVAGSTPPIILPPLSPLVLPKIDVHLTA